MTISLRPRGPFSLPSPLVVALTDDGGEAVALRAAWAEESGRVEVDFVSDLPAERVERHAARVPSRVAMAQAGRVKDALAASLGARMEIGGVEVVAFPGPRTLASLESFEGVWDSKLERIRALAGAALAGDLDPAMLRDLELDEALAHLQSLPGIGPFGATLILARGAGHPDVPPPTLRRFRAAVAAAYELDAEPDEAKLAELSEAWRPYRAWVTWLLRSVGGG